MSQRYSGHTLMSVLEAIDFKKALWNFIFSNKRKHGTHYGKGMTAFWMLINKKHTMRKLADPNFSTEHKFHYCNYEGTSGYGGDQPQLSIFTYYLNSLPSVYIIEDYDVIPGDTILSNGKTLSNAVRKFGYTYKDLIREIQKINNKPHEENSDFEELYKQVKLLPSAVYMHFTAQELLDKKIKFTVTNFMAHNLVLFSKQTTATMDTKVTEPDRYKDIVYNNNFSDTSLAEYYTYRFRDPRSMYTSILDGTEDIYGQSENGDDPLLGTAYVPQEAYWTRAFHSTIFSSWGIDLRMKQICYVLPYLKRDTSTHPLNSAQDPYGMVQGRADGFHFIKDNDLNLTPPPVSEVEYTTPENAVLTLNLYPHEQASDFPTRVITVTVTDTSDDGTSEEDWTIPAINDHTQYAPDTIRVNRIYEYKNGHCIAVHYTNFRPEWWGTDNAHRPVDEPLWDNETTWRNKMTHLMNESVSTNPYTEETMPGFIPIDFQAINKINFKRNSKLLPWISHIETVNNLKLHTSFWEDWGDIIGFVISFLFCGPCAFVNILVSIGKDIYIENISKGTGVKYVEHYMVKDKYADAGELDLRQEDITEHEINPDIIAELDKVTADSKYKKEVEQPLEFLERTNPDHPNRGWQKWN